MLFSLKAVVICRGELPGWWNEEDTEACKRHYQWELTEWWPEMSNYDDMMDYYSLTVSEIEQRKVDEWCEKHIDKFTCRRCENWQSSDGQEGYCKALERETSDDLMCEEWCPKLKMVNQLALGI